LTRAILAQVEAVYRWRFSSCTCVTMAWLARVTALVTVAMSVSAEDTDCTPPVATQGCPMALNTGAVGSCMVWGCAESRGPTVCRHGTCYCQEGYCRYPASTIHISARRCRALVPDSSCHMTRTCYKGGLTTSTCVKGECMCRSGYHIDCDGNCAKGWDPIVPPELLGNTTEMLLAAELDKQEQFEVVLNVAFAVGWLALAGSIVITAAVVGGRRLRRGQTVEESYRTLPGGEKFLAA
jgi:hypothetical protein